MRRRHRHRPYAVTPPRQQLPWHLLRPLFAFGIVAVLLLLGGNWLYKTFGTGTVKQEEAVSLQLEERDTVQVSLSDSEWKPALNVRHLYPNDSIETGPSTQASLQFFDGTVIRLDENTNIRILSSAQGERQSDLSLHLDAGTLWFSSPSSDSYTGAIVRTISSNAIRIDLPNDTEAIVSERSVAVLNNGGLGATVDIAGNGDSSIIGEGQMLTLPQPLTEVADLYDYRRAIAPEWYENGFLRSSRALFADRTPRTPDEVVIDSDVTTTTDTPLTVDTPENNTLVLTSTVEVSGVVNDEVDFVRVNGYNAQIDENNIYTIELTLPDEDEVTISVEATRSDGEVLDKQRLLVQRDREPPAAPEFTRPVQTDGTYRTQQQRLEIYGTAPPGTVGIIVNDYRLQFFEPGDPSWKYLAATTIENLEPGENVYEAVAINAAGLQSEPATITILLEDGAAGVVESGEAATDDSGEEEAVDIPVLNNDPLQPGSLQITGPQPGTDFTTNDDELLIEGLAPPGTEHMYVNDYRLRLFSPSKGFWNYIASTNLQTLKRGRNVYTITARNAAGEVIDTVDYVIRYQAN